MDRRAGPVAVPAPRSHRAAPGRRLTGHPTPPRLPARSAGMPAFTSTRPTANEVPTPSGTPHAPQAVGRRPRIDRLSRGGDGRATGFAGDAGGPVPGPAGPGPGGGHGGRR